MITETTYRLDNSDIMPLAKNVAEITAEILSNSIFAIGVKNGRMSLIQLSGYLDKPQNSVWSFIQKHPTKLSNIGTPKKIAFDANRVRELYQEGFFDKI